MTKPDQTLIEKTTLERWKNALHTQYQLQGDYSVTPRHSPEAPTVEQLSLIREAHLNIMQLVNMCLHESERAAMQDDCRGAFERWAGLKPNEFIERGSTFHAQWLAWQAAQDASTRKNEGPRCLKVAPSCAKSEQSVDCREAFNKAIFNDDGNAIPLHEESFIAGWNAVLEHKKI